MKKILSLLLCAAMLCSLIVITAQADETAQYVAADVVTALPGKTFSVDLQIANNPGVASWKITIVDNDHLGIFSEENVDNGLLSVEDQTTDGTSIQSGNLKNGILVWYGAVNFEGDTFATLTFTIPEDAEAGTYTFTLVPGSGDTQAKNAAKQAVDIATGTFTVQVIDESVITGVNVAITADLKLGIHVVTDDPDANTITAIASLKTDTDEDGELDAFEKFYTVLDSYDTGSFDGEYIFYLNLKPWAMDTEFVFDFTNNFVINEGDPEDPEDDQLDLNAIPETAKTTSILQYCENLEPSADAALKRVLADMLEYGRQAQIYYNYGANDGSGEPTYELPDTLESFATPKKADFGSFCSTNYVNGQTKKNTTASTKFVFDSADIEFGSTFTATINITKKGSTALSNARMVVNNGSAESLSKNGEYTYEFSPMEVATGAVFDLYAGTSISASNWAWSKTYGPAYYASYLYGKGEDAAALLALLEGFYNYGLSVVAYMG